MSCHSNVMSFITVLVVISHCFMHILVLTYFLKCFLIFISKWVDYQSSFYPKYSGNSLCHLVVDTLLGVKGDI